MLFRIHDPLFGFLNDLAEVEKSTRTVPPVHRVLYLTGNKPLSTFLQSRFNRLPWLGEWSGSIQAKRPRGSVGPPTIRQLTNIVLRFCTGSVQETAF